MKNRNTTIAGIITACVAILTGVKAAIDSDPATIPDYGLIIASITTACGLIFAKDSNK
tara:strand:+ start:398 stop:571 length:174 start_codon:yes stop_codon:yes gene_type:complete